MLIPITRAPGMLTRALTSSVAPAIASMCLPKNSETTKAPRYASFLKNSCTGFCSTGNSTAVNPVSPKILGLFGLRNTEKIVGTSVLRYVMKRHFSDIRKTNPAAAGPIPKDPREPYASVIRTLAPEFLKAGFIKIFEKDDFVEFSFGVNQVLKIVANRTEQPAIGLYFSDRSGHVHQLSQLMKQLDPAGYDKSSTNLTLLENEYGVKDERRPHAIREEGVRICAFLIFQYVISFMESNRKALSELGLPQASAIPKHLPEPHGSVISLLEPEFRKAGLIRFSEGVDYVNFSFGTNQYLQISMDHNKHASIWACFSDRNRHFHEINDLMMQFDSAAFNKLTSDLIGINRKYRLLDTDTPEALRHEGARVYVLSALRSMISFMESNKKALCELAPPEVKTPQKYACEPYATVIKTLEPEFLKAGLIKTGEAQFSVKFSFGPNLSFVMFTNRTFHPLIELIFYDRYGSAHSLGKLMYLLEPAAFAQDIAHLDGIRKEYRLDEDATQGTMRNEGVRQYTLLLLLQVIYFFKTHKTALAKLELSPVQPSGRLRDPYGPFIRFLDPEFVKAGLINLYEDDHSVKFALGKNQFLHIDTGRDNQLAISVIFSDKNGNQHYISELMKKFEPSAFDKRLSELNAIIKKYGLNNQPASSVEGLLFYSVALFRQVIRFIESNKKALAELPPSEVPRTLPHLREPYGSAI